MIEAVVNDAYEAVATLPLRNPAGREREVDAVIDTGYNGFLTLPPPLVAELGLPLLTQGRATLANGVVEAYNVHGVTVMLGWYAERY